VSIGRPESTEPGGWTIANRMRKPMNWKMSGTVCLPKLGSKDTSVDMPGNAVVTISLLLFFLCFQPGKIHSLESVSWGLVMSGFLLITFLTLSATQRLFAVRLVKKNGHRAQRAVPRLWQVAGSMFVLGIGLFLYFHFLGFVGVNAKAFLKIQLRVSLVTLFPLLVVRNSRRGSFSAHDSRRQEPEGKRHTFRKGTPDYRGLPQKTMRLQSRNGRESVDLNMDELLFVTSADNYVLIHSIENDGVKTRLLRTSLQDVENTLTEYAGAFRCHRTAIVNLKLVKCVSGNAQRCRLHFAATNQSIPVSRGKRRRLITLLKASMTPS